ncbi:MAG TPA: hypothetical protein PKX56_01415 [Marmoricola sp.]|nr:hypothetical protein [Marmoricola sp.]HNN47434.1 hypothetical protein [Marmoricola sp.]
MVELWTKRLFMSLPLAVLMVAGVGLWSAPAQAAVCQGSNGVTVVVDHTGVPGGSGRGIDTDCVSSNGSIPARSLFRSAGVSMVDTSRFPGLVCLVNSLPAPNPGCVMAPPADAFWGLYWSNGRDGNWIFSSIGVDGLRVPNGGSVAWVWQGGSRVNPRVKPPINGSADASQPGAGQSAPAVAKKPGATKQVRPHRKSASTGPTGTPAPSGSASPSPSQSTPPVTTTAEPEQGATQLASSTPTAEADTAPAVKDDLAGPKSEGSGLPTWIPVTLLVALSLAIGVAIAVRRRRG